MLSLQDVHVHIGKLHILQGVNLEVKPGECAALLGRNGVGKTTTLRAIMGLAPKSSGAIEFEGLIFQAARRTRFRAKASATSRKGAAFSRTCRCWRISAYRAHRANATASGRTTSSTCFPRLKERLKQSGNTLSGGEQQMLAIARCLMMRPKLIILDEPTEGIMPRLVSQIRREIHRINQSGVSILLVEQNVETALKLCRSVFLMEKGAVVLFGRVA